MKLGDAWCSGETTLLPPLWPGFDSLTWGPFLISPGNFLTRKAIVSSSASKNGEVYTPETSCMKRASVHIKNM